uniref:Putative ovule protein n=1 Tax=Solanum chacoense TaxID=4108 RepID=A0A0V0GVS8_SOLCH
MAIYDCDKFSSLCNEKDAELKAALIEKRSLEMRLPKLSSQGSKKTIPKELVDANNQVQFYREKIVFTHFIQSSTSAVSCVI